MRSGPLGRLGATAMALALGHGLLTSAGASQAPPETELLSGPPQHGVATARTAELTWTSPDPVTGWECTLDREDIACEGDYVRLTRLAAGTHTFTVAAVGEDGEADPSPAQRTWTVPRNDRALTADRRWRRVKDRAAFGGGALRTTRRGARITTSGVDVRSAALVVTSGPRAGTVAVFLGAQRLGRFDLRTPRRRHRRVVPVTDHPGVLSGEIRVVVRSRGRPVTVEGLAVETWFTVPRPWARPG